MARIIQEGIRIIREAIYKPIFEEKGFNFGFRKNHSTHHAVHRIKKLATACEIAIEGDIEGTYDNVNHKIYVKYWKKIYVIKIF
jgi:retron-type reverse transcriptase